jgi:ribokinase
MEDRGHRLTARGVVVSGSIIYDTLVHPAPDADWGTTTLVDTIESHAGGNGSNTSLALAKIGTPVRLLGSVGNDDAGRFLLDTLCRSGVDTSFLHVSDAPTAATVALVNRAGDRKFYHRMGVSGGAFAEPIDFTAELVAGMGRYHLASLFILPRLRSHAAETLARARAAGLATSLDTNWDPQGRWLEDVRPCLPHLDIIFMNEDEARMSTACTAPSAAAACLLEGGARIAVIKLGPRGCAVFTRESEVTSPAFDVDAKDTTGAGDCFVGGFLAALLRGAKLPEAARFANAMGALSVQHIGGAVGIPDGVDVEKWMRSAKVLSGDGSPTCPGERRSPI